MSSPFTTYTKTLVDEHWINIPDAPTKPIEIDSFFGGKQVIPLDELIIFRKENYENAYWRREKFPDFFMRYVPDYTAINAEHTVYDNRGRLVSLSIEDTARIIYLFDREMFRREHGVHFKNGDEIVYLTGDHYFILQWMKMYGLDEDYGSYFEFQRDWLYVVSHARADENILGAFCAKPKKTGITQIMAGVYLNKATMKRMKQMGIMSKGQDASRVNMVLFFHGFNGLPTIFKPSIRDRADVAGSVWFGEPEVKNSKSKASQDRLFALLDAEPLNTRVFAAPTKEAAFDAPLMADIWFDELPKYDTENKVQPEMVFMRNQETVKIQTKINGKCWVTSYPPEKDTPGFIQARKIYFDSKLSTIKDNPLKRTKTGLICFYISALNSHRQAFDKYGKCDKKLAKYLNDAERNSVKHDKKMYQAKLRQYSETERECWLSAGAGSTFDNIRISELEFDLLKELEVKRPYEEGRLEWTNKLWEVGDKTRRPAKQFCPVEFIPLSEEEILRGDTERLRMFEKPGSLEKNAALGRGRDKFNNLLPLAFFNNFGGADPTEYASGSEVNEGSKNGSYTMNFKDPGLDAAHQRIASGVLMSSYFFRPQNPEEFYQDLVKEIIFFGKRVIVEANKAWVATRLIADGLGYYMIVKDKEDGIMKPWAPDMDYGLIRTGAGQNGEESDHEAIVRAISAFLVAPPLGEVDYAKLIKDVELLKQLQDFNPKEWKKFDLVMAFGYTLICGQVMSVVPENHKIPMNQGILRQIYQALAR